MYALKIYTATNTARIRVKENYFVGFDAGESSFFFVVGGGLRIHFIEFSH